MSPIDCRVGELRLIFRAHLPRRIPPSESDLYAYIQWYTKTPDHPVPHIRLYEVKHAMWAHGTRAFGVVPLESLIRLAPLALKIKGDAPLDASPETAYSRFNTFFLNLFATISDFVWFRDEPLW